MNLITLATEVADSLGTKPVLALETSGMVGGLPYPDNLRLAKDVDAVARAEGVVPARIAVIDGQVKVGLDDHELDYLAAKSGTVKAGTRDMGRLVATGATGAPTVSASIQVAHVAGIDAFAVAGLGGVHRGATVSFDVSADLPQLARTPVAVMCAGVKSILDAGLTLEYLETAGVPVIGFQCDSFPGYLTVTSGRPNPARIDDFTELARAALAHWQLGNQSALVATHPIAEADGLDHELLEQAITTAMDEVAQAGITGPDVTPHTLARLARDTGGRTSKANRSVLLSTTRRGAQLAQALHHERAEQEGAR